MYLSTDQVEQLLPQKYPFRFIDTVENLDIESKSIVCKQIFKDTDFYFSGHFPSQPIVPGVLIVEAVAQAALLLISWIKNSNPDVGYLVNIRKTSFHLSLSPNEEVIIKCNINQKIGKFYIISGMVLRANTKVAKLELTLSM